MISNKEYANLIVNELSWAENDFDYYAKKTLCAEQLSGGIICFEKPALKTHFCYGWGMYAGTTEEASDSCESVENDYDVFLAENLDYNRHKSLLEKVEKEPEHVYLVKKYNESGKFVDFRVFPYGIGIGDSPVKATPEDVEKIKEGLKKQIENLTKRCASYWKRFGGSKLKTWTYWADE